MSHLPGPWHVSRLGNSTLAQLSPLHNGTLGPVALETRRVALSESCADATLRLIEAAPDMLDVLRMLSETYDAIGSLIGTVGEATPAEVMACMGEAAVKARAILKALGD